MSDKKKNKFHITITNNETGETLHDADACAIIAGINDGIKAGAILMTACGPFEFAEALAGADKAVKRVRTNHPEVAAMSMLLALTGGIEEEPETEEPETEEPENNQ